ncbi:MAG TPA: LacI family DNA-binding transcriptional regulator [Chthonomonadales bacterium]|nr:LacI family DNA-binding transcriptional regulator [Chthonomonadales bacterium]
MTRSSSQNERRGSARRATLSDISNRCNVSVGTASAVLAGKSRERRISEAVALRIRQVAAEIDYAPNLLVRSMQRGRTHMLSFFNGFRHCYRGNYYMDALNSAIQHACGTHGYDVVVYCDFSRSALETYRYLNGGRSDGLIFFTPQLDEPLLPYLRQSRLPVVLLNGEDPQGALSSVRDDVEAGMRLAARRLLDLEHHRVAILSAPGAFNPDAPIRAQLLRSILCQAGACCPGRWVIDTEFTSPLTIRRALESLLAEDEPPTALFCWQDLTGYLALEMCEEMGVDVPERMSIVGYDGLRWPARTRHVLASVRVNLDAMGQAAVELLDRLINEPAHQPVRTVIPVEFENGTTLGPAARIRALSSTSGALAPCAANTQAPRKRQGS